MPALLLLFVALPALELVLLIEIGTRIGTVATLGLIVATGILGATLARRQGLGVVRRLQSESRAGRLPADSLIDGAFVLVAGALLVTPGVLTDVFGFLCLVPAFRRWVKSAARRRFERAVREGRIHVQFHGSPGASREPFGDGTWPGSRWRAGSPGAMRDEPREEKVVRDLRDAPASIDDERRDEDPERRGDGPEGRP